MFGFAYGGVMPLYAILVREYFGARIMGTMFGAVALVSTLGMAIGPWAGGWLYDTFGSYFWLYIGSFGDRPRGGGDRLHVPPAAAAAGRTGRRGHGVIPLSLLGWTAPRHRVPDLGCEQPRPEPSMPSINALASTRPKPCSRCTASTMRSGRRCVSICAAGR